MNQILNYLRSKLQNKERKKKKEKKKTAYLIQLMYHGIQTSHLSHIIANGEQQTTSKIRFWKLSICEVRENTAC